MSKIFGLVNMAIAPGTEEQFRELAQACIDAARQDLTGTLAYEWFLSPDGSECTVIEIYDGPEAVAHHRQMVGHTIAPVLEIAKLKIHFAGDVPDAIVDRMRLRLGEVEYFGPRFQGKLNSPAAGLIGADAGKMIFAIARFKVQKGKEVEFRQLAEHCFAIVDADEPDTIGYEWFLDTAGSECMTVDVYRDEKALVTHMTNVGPTMARILDVVSSEVQLYGGLSEELRGRFQEGLGIQFIASQIGGVM